MAELNRKRRCFRFSLRTVFVMVTATGCTLGWIGTQSLTARHRRGMLIAIYDAPDHAVQYPVLYPLHSSLWFAYREWLFNDHPVETIYLPASLMDRCQEVEALFPEATIVRHRQDSRRHEMGGGIVGLDYRPTWMLMRSLKPAPPP